MLLEVTNCAKQKSKAEFCERWKVEICKQTFFGCISDHQSCGLCQYVRYFHHISEQSQLVSPPCNSNELYDGKADLSKLHKWPQNAVFKCFDKSAHDLLRIKVQTCAGDLN